MLGLPLTAPTEPLHGKSHRDTTDSVHQGQQLAARGLAHSSKLAEALKSHRAFGDFGSNRMFKVDTRQCSDVFRLVFQEILDPCGKYPSPLFFLHSVSHVAYFLRRDPPRPSLMARWQDSTVSFLKIFIRCPSSSR